MDIDLLKQLLPGNDVDFYLCGPPPFMKSLFDGLVAWGVPEDRIHYEFFGAAAALKEGEKGDRAEGATDIEVRFARSGVSANWNPSFGTLLDMAEELGLSPAYSCRSGICGTCMCELTGGEVEYLEEPLDPPGPGRALICCSRPSSNLVIEV